jgi:hypothetical protein
MSFTDPDFRGCAFVSARAEARPGGAVEQESDTYRYWGFSSTWLSRPGHAIPKPSPAGISAWMDRDPSAENAARAVASALVDAAVPSTT